MIIETTFNCDNKTALKLNKAAYLTRKTRSEMIILVMKRFMEDHHHHLKPNQGVKYQKKPDNAIWEPQHLRLFLRDYEFFLDMKKFCKRSVSSMIAFAVENYLNEIVERIYNAIKESKKEDNNQFIHYVLIREIIDNAVCWKIYWGLPYTLTHLYRQC